MTKDEALKLALEVLELAEDGLAYSKPVDGDKLDAAIAAIKQALEAPVQESFEDLATELFAVAQVSPTDDGFSETIERIEAWLQERFGKAQTAPVEPAKYSDIVSDGGMDPRNKFDVAPVHEPRGYQWLDTAIFRKKLPDNAETSAWHALYTAPPAQQRWVGLTDEEIEDWWDGHLSDYQLQMIRELEAKIKEKNT